MSVTLCSPSLVQRLIMMALVLQDFHSPLFSASLKGHLEIVMKLIEAGADVNLTDKVNEYTFLQCH